eukprot:3287214-Alexandrium_andersonii.AAC.1
MGGNSRCAAFEGSGTTCLSGLMNSSGRPGSPTEHGRHQKRSGFPRSSGELQEAPDCSAERRTDSDDPRPSRSKDMPESTDKQCTTLPTSNP